MSQLMLLGTCRRLHGEAVILLLSDMKRQPDHMFLTQPRMEELWSKALFDRVGK